MGLLVRSRGKRVDGWTFAFTALQGFALVFFVSIAFQYFSAKYVFGDAEFLPVEITYTDCVAYETWELDSDGDRRDVIRYNHTYIYVVDGVQYEGHSNNMSSAVTPGQTRQRYYDPEDPNRLSGYRSFKDQMKSANVVIIVFLILEVLAVVCLVVKKRKEIELRKEEEREEELIRQDIQRNREVYDKLDVSVKAEAVFAVLDPMRKNIYATKKKLTRLEKNAGVVVGGNPLFILGSVIANAIRTYQINKLKDKLSTYNSAFYSEYRKSIAEPVLRTCFESYRYLPNQGFSFSELKDFHLFTDVGDVYCEDYIEGNYKNVGYRQSDVTIDRRTTEGRITIFSGRLAVYDFKKNLEGQIAVIEKGYSGASLQGLKKIEMENVSFNEKFKVYASNGHLAFYLLTPQFMEYIMDLNARGELYIRFSSNKIFILRNRISGIFQPDMRTTLDIQYEVGKSYHEIKEILNFIDILNLDRVADEANLRASYSDEEDSFVSESEEKTKFGVVDEEDSIFGGPDFESPDLTPAEEPLFHEPDINKSSASGIKLKL